MATTGANGSSRRTAVVVALAMAVVAVAGCGGDDGASDPAAGPGATAADPTTAADGASEAGATTVADVVELRPLQAEGTRIVDDQGRDVLLRGTNITSLGEYWQGDPDHEPTQPMTDADWEAMSARGFSVVRLIVTWSRIEPTRGEIDQAYLDEVDAYVDAAADHGMYTVIDMHQDAYSAFISTPEGESCPEGSEPAKGWDGAPEWATITDGLSTCITGDRNSSLAVTAAWNHFYDDTDGIQGRFVASWAAVAERFAGRPEVAGFDLLNEPDVSRPGAELEPLYDALILDTVTAIREAEEVAGAPFQHLLFVEPAIPAGNPMHGIVIPDPVRMGVDPTNIVAAPHNYAESIGEANATVEEMNELYVSVADGIGVPTWIGEWGWWDTSEESLEELDRMAIDMDARGLGGAWWQWRQPCGDPHSVRWGEPWSEREPEESVHLNTLGCPGDEDRGPTEELLRVVGRGYPRAFPGTFVDITGDWETGRMILTADAGPDDVGQQVVAWTPTSGETHYAGGPGLEDVEEHVVPGGRIITATVAAQGRYKLYIESEAAVSAP